MWWQSLVRKKVFSDYITFKGLVAKIVVEEMAQLVMCFPCIKIWGWSPVHAENTGYGIKHFQFHLWGGERCVFVGLTVPISNLQILWEILFNKNVESWGILLWTLWICRYDWFNKQVYWPIVDLDKFRWQSQTENAGRKRRRVKLEESWAETERSKMAYLSEKRYPSTWQSVEKKYEWI